MKQQYSQTVQSIATNNQREATPHSHACCRIYELGDNPITLKIKKTPISPSPISHIQLIFSNTTTKNQHQSGKRKGRESCDLGGGLGSVGVGLDGLLEGLDVLLDVLALVLVLQPERLVLHDLLLLRQIGLRLLLRRHPLSPLSTTTPQNPHLKGNYRAYPLRFRSVATSDRGVPIRFGRRIRVTAIDQFGTWNEAVACAMI